MVTATKARPKRVGAPTPPTDMEVQAVLLVHLSAHVPCDEGGVEALVGSISAMGQLHPIAIHRDGRIIDGFHRVEAMQRLGYKEIRAVVQECNEVAFWDRRIAEAIRHDLVKWERLIQWMREAYLLTDFLDAWPGLDEAMRQWWNWRDVRRPAPGLREPGTRRKIPGDDPRAAKIESFDTWFSAHTQRWGLRPSSVARTIFDHQRGASLPGTLKPGESPTKGTSRKAGTLRSRSDYRARHLSQRLRDAVSLLANYDPPQPFDCALLELQAAITAYGKRGVMDTRRLKKERLEE